MADDRLASRELEGYYGKQICPQALVRHYRTFVVRDCTVNMPRNGEAPWLDTQDLHGFNNGAVITGRPLRVQAEFNRPSNGGQLSDRDGYNVTYRPS